MIATLHRRIGGGLASLRRLVSSEAPEPCELCGHPLAETHEHLIDPKNRRLVCTCQACALLFDHPAARYRRVPRDVRRLGAMADDGVFWNGLGIPIGLVFLFESSVTNQALALYPSPAGPTEAEVDSEAWADLKKSTPELRSLRCDVEALLAKRTGGTQQYYVAPIDECYRLTGLIRRHWRGFSGGDEAWTAIDGFFAELSVKALPAGAASHA
ncbi:MAG TPA: DUF5947 family protein [Bryobacteraceae bacterium]|jgi:hypothetical protein|nr:DUF5947 family protein [Bryobacteraceae bacterium]